MGWVSRAKRSYMGTSGKFSFCKKYGSGILKERND
jgi:hypothetical protein